MIRRLKLLKSKCSDIKIIGREVKAVLCQVYLNYITVKGLNPGESMLWFE